MEGLDEQDLVRLSRADLPVRNAMGLLWEPLHPVVDLCPSNPASSQRRHSSYRLEHPTGPTRYIQSIRSEAADEEHASAPSQTSSIV